jgi:hypothetical protein
MFHHRGTESTEFFYLTADPGQITADGSEHFYSADLAEQKVSPQGGKQNVCFFINA